jgi:hypothetical protein
MAQKYALRCGNVGFGISAIQPQRGTLIGPEAILNLHAAILKSATNASVNQLFETLHDLRFTLVQHLCQRGGADQHSSGGSFRVQAQPDEQLEGGIGK